MGKNEQIDKLSKKYVKLSPSKTAITYSECYAPLFIDRKQYEEDLQRWQKEHLDGVYNRQNQNWRPCLHDSCPDCLGTGVKQ